MNEPEIIINGKKLTTAQAMTLRVAIGTFIISLEKDGLGEDKVGLSIKDGYLQASASIQLYMLEGYNK